MECLGGCRPAATARHDHHAVGSFRELSTIRYELGVDAAGMLLREARLRVGLSQVELGRGAGVTQSVVSAYESGARQLSVPMLARLVAATGSELDMRRSAPATTEPTSPRVFGSVARGEEGIESDVDLLVDVPEGVGLVTLGRCQVELDRLLGVPVHLVPANDLRAQMAAGVLAGAVAL